MGEEKMILNGVEYVRKSEATNTERKIVVLQRGWIVVGDYMKDGNYGVLTNASVIRRWGTDKGLGQLAIEGKQEETVLDSCGTVRFHEMTSVMIIDVTSNI